MAEKYYSILTNRGKELEAQSSASGKPVIIKDFVVGDGNGQLVKPDPALTTLAHEVYRAAISALQVSPDQANQFIAQLVLPAGVGGFVVREVGLLTDAGELYAVANCAAIEKPVSGISVKLQFRLAVSETADIELKVATGDGLFLRQDANLGDVNDAAESRKNIGLKGAAVLDVGTTENTVAAGNDIRIVNALQKENNLSDLEDKPQARDNLELKSAATADVQTSRDDITAGRLIANGGALAVRSVFAKAGTAITDASGLPANSVSFCYSDAAYSPGYEATILDVGGLRQDYRVQYAASYADGGKQLKFRTLNGDNGNWGAWTSVITNYGGSVEYLDGAKYIATKPENWKGSGAFANQYADATAPFFIPGYTTPNGVSVYLPIVKGTSVTSGHGYGASVSFGILRTGNNDFGSAVVHIIGDNGNGATYGFDTKGVFNAPGQLYSGGTISAVGQISNGSNIVAGLGLYESGGAVRVYSTNNPPPNQSGSTTTGNYSAYYSHGNGQIFMQCIGGVYSDSRTNPDVTVYLPASFPNGILAISGSYNGNGGQDSDSWWSAGAISANAFNLHTRNTAGTFSFVVTGY